MLLLEQLAHNVVDTWEKGDLAAAVRSLDGQLKEIPVNREAHEETIETARKRYVETSDNNIEIDDDPVISVGDEGVWVGAWVWIPIEHQDS